MSQELLRSLRSGAPVSPAVQMRMLLEFARQHDWSFDVAWRWSWARVKWPHDTTHRLEWKAVLGSSASDGRSVPCRQREIWRRAYERSPQTPSELGCGRLLVAA